ncbi:unnamed protein product [Miscanthus lutarioriparius]|uniref:Rx N-terminal domain-containing protein n=1 Tax=Miscanthus lutarioriparius TaxID=422564 RepID=A0A811PAV0_9POAL|nr:unnamed protein product [Miscanthus lutarioriparius]
MAALTQSAIDALLGVLTTAIQDEARLIGGVHSDMKFIKDEMDSMNGFLLHLNKMESEHDDQVRAWMKQVREVSYVAEDCVDRYRRVLGSYGEGWGRGGCAGTLAFVLAHPKAYLQLHKLGKQIAELKARVHDVGERRQRYDVNVPTGRDLKMVQNKLPDQEEEKREAFVHALEKDVVGTPGWFRPTAQHARAPAPASAPDPDPLDALLLEDVRGPSEAAMMRAILKKCCPPDHPRGAGGVLAEAEAEANAKAELDIDPREAAAFRCTRKMFLCAMYVYPYPTSQELKKLKDKVVGVTEQELKELKDKVGVEAHGPGVVGAQEARKQVMIFCYSILTTQQKSCLQYLTAFLHEKEISRTSMVRRWVAEGLVGKEPGGGRTTTTPEEAGERCFRELLLRGFIRAARWSDAGTVKSCVMDDPVRDFIDGITKSENFVAELPVHLDRQLKIRSIVQRRASMPPPPPPPMLVPRCNLRCCGGGCTWLLDDHRASEDDTAKDPMDELVDFIRGLPELYRLNVLDLGGCTGLKSRHLKSFAEVKCLKYLSLRNTDVSRLHATHINKLKLLETLDIRETNIPPRDTVSIYLPKLKHLLAGRFSKTTTATTMPAVEKGSLVTVHMPDSIGSMRDMETLSHVQVSMDGAELQGVAKLHQLRKLGVVVHANTTTAAFLGRVIYMLAANLRSLSIWVAIAVPHTTTTPTTQQGGGTGILDISSMYEMASSLALENLDIKGKMSLPSWIERTSKLANVTLRDTEMDGGDTLRRLATVQSLRCLKLSRKAFTEQALRFKDVQFQALKFLVVEGDAVTRIAFFDDAAPKLEKIVWTIGGGSKIAQMYNEDLIVGINHLPLLKEIELRASFKLTNLSKWTNQQAATSGIPRYGIRYISSSDGQLITELPRTGTHTTLSLPAGVIN